MATVNGTRRIDPYLGAFASIVLALIAAGPAAALLLSPFQEVLGATAERVQLTLTSGTFFAIVAADPVNTLANRGGLRQMVLRALGGMAFGVALDRAFLGPMAGDGLTGFIRLLLAALYLPVVLGCKTAIQALEARGFHPVDRFARAVLALVGLPDRLLFILAMTLSFVVFWAYAENLREILIGLAAVLATVTAVVALRREKHDRLDTAEADFKAWLALEPEEPEQQEALIVKAAREFWRKARTLMPGAILLGGITRLSVDVLVRIFPSSHNALDGPFEAARSVGLLAASGLGVVFFGMFAALVFCLMLLQVIARIAGWSERHHRESCYRLLQTMHFRPMRRG